MNGMQLKELAYNGIYRAKVEDNLDPSQYGRIKARAYPMFADIEVVDQLPWAVPAMGLFTGSGLTGEYTEASGYSGTSFGSFCVPNIGTFVFVFFENGDPYQPVYFAEAHTAGYGLPVARTTDYPDTKVWLTKNNIQIKINDYFTSTGTSGTSGYSAVDHRDIRVDHPNGSWMEMYPDGRITFHTTLPTGDILSRTTGHSGASGYSGASIFHTSAKDITQTAVKNILTESTEGTIDIIADQGKITINAMTDDIEIHASKANVTIIADEGDVSVEATDGNVDVTASGDATVTATGSVTIEGATVEINP